MTATITVSGTAFTAVSVNIKNRSKQELQDEQISLNAQKINGTNAKENDFVYDSKQMKDDDEQTVVFDDATSGKKVAVLLDKNTIEKLKTHFGEDDVYTRNDGIVRLNNKAESFVAGWFEDIAYKREVLNADTNKDNKIDKEEYSKTKSFMHGYIEVSANANSMESIKDVATENYADGSRVLASDYVQNLKSDYTSLDNILNDSINTDSNYDKSITLEETLKFTYKTNNITLAVAKDTKDLFGNAFGNDITKALDNLITKEISKKQQDEEEQKKKLEALQKLMASGGDISVLSAEERLLVQSELVKYTKTSDKYDIKELQNLYEAMQKTNEYKNAIEDNTLGKYYERKS
ncbi:MAG: hypothetical protein PHE67_03245 [Campylobacterales bacterium]|nr:hypothetical protein [Campylobacterales bacterium]